jgi:hypothetical protein
LRRRRLGGDQGEAREERNRNQAPHLAWLLGSDRFGSMQEPLGGWDRLTPVQKMIAEGAGCAVVFAIVSLAATLSQPLGPMLVSFLHWLAASLH